MGTIPTPTPTTQERPADDACGHGGTTVRSGSPTLGGPYPLVIIKEPGLQLRERNGAKPETVLAEDLAEAPNPGGGKK